jgi:putative transposase
MSFHLDATKHRRSIRLKRYDYSQSGAYFVTIVTHERKCLFGKIEDGEVRLNDVGRMAEEAWIEVPNHYSGVECDTFLIMPNHIHAVIVLVGAGHRARPEPNRQPRGVAPTRNALALSLPDVVHRFKTLTTKRYTDGVKQFGWNSFSGRLWQRNYFEHVIRNDESLDRIREYILDNPMRWEFDRDNPLVTRPEPKDAWRTIL